MISSENYYRITEVNSNIRVCFISIPEYIRRFIPRVDFLDYHRRKNILFDPESELQVFFTKQDFEKINSFKVLKKQLEWMAGKVAVKKLVAEMGLVSEVSVGISAEKSGAPFLVDFPELNISISHSGTYAVAGIGKNGALVAVDIEKIEYGRMENISHVAFTERELEHLQNAREEDYYTNWTVKEAFLKYIKKGFAEGLKKVEIISGGVLHHGRQVKGISVDSEIISGGYAYTIIY